MIIGIDPGISGAIAVLSDTGELSAIYDMPIMTVGKGKSQVDGKSVADILKQYQPCTVILEFVSAMPGQGVTSMFNFGVGYGIVQGILCTLSIPWKQVRSDVWKRQYGLLKQDKDMARTVAKRLYPQAELNMKKHIGRADALLIARYGMER